jgi:hypothetical protein
MTDTRKLFEKQLKNNKKQITYKFLAAVHAKKINRSTNLS